MSVIDPQTLPLLRGGRLRKRWRWRLVVCDELLVCAARVEIGVARQTFWGLWDRERRELHGRTTLRDIPSLDVEGDRLRFDDGGVRADLACAPAPRHETLDPSGRAFTWTAKEAGAPALGTVALPSRTVDVRGASVLDVTAGYHPRHTRWRWAAGVGETADGRTVAWNLVSGLNDAEVGSERALWIDGAVRELPPCSFDPSLGRIAFPDGAALRFESEAVRARNEHRGIVRSHYVQPFGRFTGSLPGGIELRRGLGVTEHHDVHW